MFDFTEFMPFIQSNNKVKLKCDRYVLLHWWRIIVREYRKRRETRRQAVVLLDRQFSSFNWILQRGRERERESESKSFLPLPRITQKKDDNHVYDQWFKPFRITSRCLNLLYRSVWLQACSTHRQILYYDQIKMLYVLKKMCCNKTTTKLTFK